jgi:hypothetical protein
MVLIGFLVLIVNALLTQRGCGPSRELFSTTNRLNLTLAALNSYQTEYGQRPDGDNAAIMRALRGDNPKKLIFLEGRREDFNDRGEIIDGWHSPIRIGGSDSAKPWAYSFGKNQKDEGGAYGSDDVVSWR